MTYKIIARFVGKIYFLICKYVYVWIYENGAKKLNSSSKVDDIKIKGKLSPFCLPLAVYLPFLAFLSLFFCPFTWPGEGLKVE